MPSTFSGSSFFQELLYINDLFSSGTLWSLRWSGSREYPSCLHLYSWYANIIRWNLVVGHGLDIIVKSCTRVGSSVFAQQQLCLLEPVYIQGTWCIAGFQYTPGPFSSFCPSGRLFAFIYRVSKQACLGTPLSLCWKWHCLCLWYQIPCSLCHQHRTAKTEGKRPTPPSEVAGSWPKCLLLQNRASVQPFPFIELNLLLETPGMYS